MLAQAAPTYGGAAVVTGAAQPALRQAYEGMLPPRTQATIRHDPTLDFVGQILAVIYLRTQRVPAYSLEQWIFWRAGATTIPAGFDIFAFQGEGADGPLNQRLAELARQQKEGRVPLSYGLVRIAFPEGFTVQVLVRAGRPLEVPALKKMYAPGEELAIAVRPTVAYTDLMLYADAGGGDVRTAPMTVGADQSAWAKVPLPAQPGRYFIQIAATEPVADAVDPEHPWRHSLLHFPLYVGVPEPVEPDDFIRHPIPNPPNPVTWRELILRSFNAERARLGRGPLVLDPRAGTIAQQHSDEVANTQGEPRPDPHIAEELRAVGIPVQDLGNTLEYLEFVSEYVHMHLLEPAARHHLLAPATTLLGLGLTQRPGGDVARPWAVIEYAIEQVGPVDVAKERARIHVEFASLDTADNLPTTASDDALSGVAQEVAEEICRGVRKVDDPKGIWERDRAKAATRGFKAAGSYSWMGYRFTRAEIARVREGTKGHGYSRFGIGICQADFPNRPRSTFVLWMMGG
jgi:hypothetical protein